MNLPVSTLFHSCAVLAIRKLVKHDWLKAIFYAATYLAALVLSGVYLFLSYWYVWVSIALVGLLLIVSWHAKISTYHCPKCEHEFRVSVLIDFISAHGVDNTGGWKYLKCPICSNRSRMRILTKEHAKSS